MLKRILMAVSGRLPCKIIKDGHKPYLERYYVGTILGARIYLHRFVACDPDRGLHDHPWRWAFSLILSGYYYEMIRRAPVVRKVRWFNILTGDSFHRVILPVKPINKSKFYNAHMNSYRQQCWTLFVHSAPRVKDWGFLRDIGEREHIYTSHRSGEIDEWWKTAELGRTTKGRMA